MNDSCQNTNGLHKMLPTMLTTYVVFDFSFFKNLGAKRVRLMSWLLEIPEHRV